LKRKKTEKICKTNFFTEGDPTGHASHGIFRALRCRWDSNPQPLPRV
jgi:hypothetical protein